MLLTIRRRRRTPRRRRRTLRRPRRLQLLRFSLQQLRLQQQLSVLILRLLLQGSPRVILAIRPTSLTRLRPNAFAT